MFAKQRAREQGRKEKEKEKGGRGGVRYGGDGSGDAGQGLVTRRQSSLWSHTRGGRRCVEASVSTQPRQQREDKRQRLKPGPRPAVQPRLLSVQSCGTSTSPATFTFLIAPIWLLFIEVEKRSRHHSDIVFHTIGIVQHYVKILA